MFNAVQFRIPVGLCRPGGHAAFDTPSASNPVYSAILS